MVDGTNDDPLSLRPLATDDEALYCRIYTDPWLMRHVAAPLGRSAALRRFERALAGAPARVRLWVVEARGGLGAVGLAGFTLRDDSAELGVMLLAQAHGHGYASRALRCLMAHAFNEHGVHEVWLEYAPDNAAMGRVADRLGLPRSSVVGAGDRIRRAIGREEWSAGHDLDHFAKSDPRR